MAWDPSRQVPWARLIKDWLIYAGIMIVIFLVFAASSFSIGTVLGLAASLPLYLVFGGVLAKFGYTRKTMKEIRAEKPVAPASASGSTTVPGRPKPPPTKRTSSAPSKSKKKR